jgi:cytochrome P450
MGYDAVRAVLTEPVFSRAAAATASAPRTGIGRLSVESLLGLDPPEHTRLRKVIAGTFTRRGAERLRPRVRELADELAGRLFTAQPPADLVSAFSLPLPVMIICELLGIPARDREFFHATSDVLVSGWTRDPVEVKQAFSDLSAYFADLIPVKRAEPRDDLLTTLVTAHDTGQQLSADEVVLMAITLLVAGHETVAGQLSLFVLTLLDHPHELQRLRDNPGLLANAVEELLRFIPLSDGAGALVRIALADTELGGQHIMAGDAVIPAIPAANRDPAVFPDPDALDLTRTQVRHHLSFGAGFHNCVGTHFARVELQEGLRAILERLPAGTHIPVDHSALECRTFVSLRSVRELPLSW